MGDVMADEWPNRQQVRQRFFESLHLFTSLFGSQNDNTDEQLTDLLAGILLVGPDYEFNVTRRLEEAKRICDSWPEDPGTLERMKQRGMI